MIVDVVEMLLAQKTADLTIMRQKTKQLAKKLQNNSGSSIASPIFAEKPCLGAVFEGDRCKKYRLLF